MRGFLCRKMGEQFLSIIRKPEITEINHKSNTEQSWVTKKNLKQSIKKEWEKYAICTMVG